MSETRKSRMKKNQVIRFVEDYVGRTDPVRGCRNWRVTADGRLSALVTYSKAHQDQNGLYFWYGVNSNGLQCGLWFERPFVLFVMGSCTEVLVVLAREVQQLVAARETTGNGIFIFHLDKVEEGRYEFREAPGIDLTHYYNNYSLLAEQRSACGDDRPRPLHVTMGGGKLPMHPAVQSQQQQPYRVG